MTAFLCLCRTIKPIRAGLWVWIILLSSAASAAAPVRIEYNITFLPREKSAEVRIEIERADWLKQARFNLTKHKLEDIEYSGNVGRTEDALIWYPQRKGKAFFSYKIPIIHQRSSGAYDAYITDDWALLRGEDLVPPVRVTRVKKRKSEVYVSFSLPEKWTSVNSGWRLTEDREAFLLNKTKRVLPRPDGWIIAGELGTRHEQMLRTHVAVSAPRGHNFRQMELVTFLSMIWPQIDKLFPRMPEKILIAGASDPMWRGGLSSPTSLYLHSDRPLVSENGTSTLIHELIHVISGIHGIKEDDWITEGLAEYYSVELIYRAGGFSAERREKIFNDLEAWGKDVKTLRHERASGPITARAAVFFNALDREIQKSSSGRYTLDHLVQGVIEKKYLGLADLQSQYKTLLGVESGLLKSPLVR